MVYQDFPPDSGHHSDSRLNSTQRENPVLLDRFFSFLIDYVVLSPFVSFFVYFFFKDAILFWRANPDAPEQFSLIAIIAVSGVVVFSLLQATFIYLWRATPGQYFLKMQIQFADGHLLFWRAFLRQFGFWCTPLFLGIPWIAMLSHPQHKTFYDRLADCRIVSFKSERGFTFEAETKYWQSLLATLILFVGFLFASFIWTRYDRIIQRVASFQQLEKNNFFCEDLKSVSLGGRLQTAVAMNVVGQVTDDCLDREADFVIWKDKSADLSLAYFAKSLTEKNTKQETEYLNEACATETDLRFAESSLGCQLAQTSISQNYERMYARLATVDNLLGDTYRYEYGLALGKKMDVVKNFTTLKKYSTLKLVKRYLLSEMISEMSSEKPAGGRAPASDQSIYDVDTAKEWISEL